ncbi:MAG: hypothetical protein ACREEN_00975, partial [Stellaceae bacterium]
QFRSEPPRERNEWTMDEFRLLGITGGMRAEIAVGMHIANPRATAYLDRYDVFMFELRVAYGRRTDAEIAMRQTMLDDWLKDGKPGEEYWVKHKALLEKRLARAKGEVA